MAIGDPWVVGEERTYSVSRSTFQPSTWVITNTYTEFLQPGIYTIEMYGGQGSGGTNIRGGYGGHSVGSLKVSGNTTIYIHAGVKGVDSSQKDNYEYSDYGGGFRDHRKSGLASRYTANAGGGSSDVRLRQDNVLARLIVAGGGGGWGGTYEEDYPQYTAHGGNGGGLVGGDGNGLIYGRLKRTDDYNIYASDLFNGRGGTQTAPGGGGNTSELYSPSFTAENGDVVALGYGGTASQTTDTYSPQRVFGGGSGGGGWHGGGGGLYQNEYGTSGGGGSGYIYTQESSADYPSGCLLTPLDYLFDYEGNGLYTEQSDHTGDGVVYIRCEQLGGGAVPVWVKMDNAWVENSGVWGKLDNAWLEADYIGAKIDNAFQPPV